MGISSFGVQQEQLLCVNGWSGGFPYIVSNSVVLHLETIISTDIDDLDAGVSVSGTSRFLLRGLRVLRDGIGFGVVQIIRFRRFRYVSDLKSDPNRCEPILFSLGLNRKPPVVRSGQRPSLFHSPPTTNPHPACLRCAFRLSFTTHHLGFQHHEVNDRSLRNRTHLIGS